MVVPWRVSVHDGLSAEGVDFLGEGRVVLEEFGDGVRELVSGDKARVVATEVIRQLVDDEPVAFIQVASGQQVGLLEVFPDERVVGILFQECAGERKEMQKRSF